MEQHFVTGERQHQVPELGEALTAVTAEAVTAEPVTAEAVTTEAVTAEAVTAEAVTAEAVTAEAVTAEAVTAEAVLACAIDAWYPLPGLQGVSLRTEIIPLPEEFVHFLQQDGLHLPASSQALPKRDAAGEWEAHDDEYEQWRDEEDTSEEPQVPEFPDLEAAVNSAIERLGGAVLPKLNWSCPKDAAWLSSSGSLRCSNAAEVFLLLKGSDCIAHDLNHAFDSCPEPRAQSRPARFVLALRKWLGIRPEMEFRCFVRDRQIIGISQREVTSFYPVHADSARMDTVKDKICRFFEDTVSPAFPLSHYVMDLYVTSAGNVKLVDFNPFGEPTLPLMFTWEELNSRAMQAQPAQPPVPVQGEPAQTPLAMQSEPAQAPVPLQAQPAQRPVPLQAQPAPGDTSHTTSTPGRPRPGEEPAECPPLDEQGCAPGCRGGQGAAECPTPGQQGCARGCGGPLQPLPSTARGGEEPGRVEMRLVLHPQAVRPSLRALSGVPFDMVDSSPGGSLEEFMQRMATPDTRGGC